MLLIQFAASAATLLAGIMLWHLLHSGGMGPAEHRLVVGTFCAFVALGLQLGTVGVLVNGPLTAGALGLSWAGVVALAFAAATMVASRLT